MEVHVDVVGDFRGRLFRQKLEIRPNKAHEMRRRRPVFIMTGTHISVAIAIALDDAETGYHVS